MRVLVADDDIRFRDLLKDIIKQEPSLALVGVANNDEEALRIATETSPDVVLLDVQMLGGQGVLAARQIRKIVPGVRILALSGTRDRERVIAMMRAGAAGYLAKAATPGEILRMLTDATADNVTLSRAAAIDVLIDPSDPHALEEARLIESLLGGDHIDLVLQPIFDLKTTRIAGYEALARFAVEPKAGPAVWLSRAEKAGLRNDLEFAILAKALPIATTIPEDTYLCVNLSPSAVMSDQCETAFWNSQPDRVIVEITEQLPVQDYPRMRNRIADLRAMGMRIAIDDVGAGFASLRHILELAPECIKLDTSLIRHIDHDSPRRALATALITFAEEVNASVVAEGVETKGELEILKNLGVGFAQGFHLARPRPFLGPSQSSEPGGRVSDLVESAVAAVANARTETEALEGLATGLSPHLPLDRVSLRMPTSSNQLGLTAVWQDRHSSIEAGSTVSAVATPYPEVLRRDGPVSSSDPGIYHPLVEEVLSVEGIRSWVSLPLHRPGEMPAMLSFASRTAHAFDEVKVDVLSRVGAAVESRLIDLWRGRE